MTILCEPDRASATEIAASLEESVHAVLALTDVEEAARANPAEDVLVLGQGVPLNEALDFAAYLRRTSPGVAVLLVRREVLDAEVEAARLAGISAVVPSGRPELLTEACRGARDQLAQVMVLDDTSVPHDEPPAGRIITVFSPKGGSGKTTTSTNLAAALHRGGARRVCLIDLDLEFGDVAISLQLTPVRSLIDAVTTEMSSDDDDLIAPLITEYRPGFDCVLAPIEPGAAAKIPTETIADLLAVLRHRYDFVVVDTPSQFSENVLAALDASDHHVLLTNPEIPSLKNLRLTLDTLDLLGYPRQARSIVFNRADDAAGLTAADVEEALNMPITAHVPASRDVPPSINRGVPIVESKPDHPVSVAFRAFAASVIDGEVAAPKRSGLGRLFRRRSS